MFKVMIFMLLLMAPILTTAVMLLADHKYDFQFEAQSHVNNTNHSFTQLFVVNADLTMVTTNNGNLKLYFLYYGTRNDSLENPTHFHPLHAFENTDFKNLGSLEEMGFPCQFHINHHGLVDKISFDKNEEKWSKNLKKSVLNLLSMRNVSTSYLTKEEYVEKAFVKSETSFDGECETQYTIKPSLDKTVNVTKNIDYDYCQSSTSSFDFLLPKSLRYCKNQNTEIVFELKGNVGNYTFEKSNYKTSCTSSDDNGNITRTTIMKMFLFSSDKTSPQELAEHENDESIMFTDEISTSWNRSIKLPDVCNVKTCNWKKVPGAVTAIKDQGHCNTCYSFTSIAILESFNFNFITGVETVLSEQNLQDCLPGKKGQNWKCMGNGGDPKEALSLINTIGGIHRAKSYPWIGANARCQRLQEEPVITGNEYMAVKKYDIPRSSNLMELVQTYGPVAASVTKKKMVGHKGKGIITDCIGSNNHAITIVGWDTRGNVTFWIVKNSWGTDHGDKGYFYIKMTDNDFDCNIKSEVTFLKPRNLYFPIL